MAVSPAVDVSAYAFSWLFILLPLTYFSSREHQIVMLLAVVGLTFAHRHYTLPCVYLDREIFDTHPKRFTWFPLLMLIGFPTVRELALPLVDAMARARPLLLVPAIACVVAGLGIFGVVWAFYWSVYQSLVHFYYDGFLWKMRMPWVQANI